MRESHNCISRRLKHSHANQNSSIFSQIKSTDHRNGPITAGDHAPELCRLETVGSSADDGPNVHDFINDFRIRNSGRIVPLEERNHGSEGVSGVNSTESVLLDIQSRAYEQYPFLAEGGQSCTVTDNELPDNPIIWVNEEFESMTLYPREEIIGRNCRFLQGPGTSREMVAGIKRAVLSGEPSDVEILNYRKDGVAFWNRFKILPVYDRDSIYVTHFVAIQNDITILKDTSRFWNKWTPGEVGSWLITLDLGDFSKKFMEKNIPGNRLGGLKTQELLEMGMSFKETWRFSHTHTGENYRRRKVADVRCQSDSDIMEEKKKTISVKCYLDHQPRIFRVRRKTKFIRFLRTLRREMKQEFMVKTAYTGIVATKELWAQWMEQTQSSLTVVLTPVRNSMENPSRSNAALELFSTVQTTTQELLSGKKALEQLFANYPHLKESPEFINTLFRFFQCNNSISSLIEFAIHKEIDEQAGANTLFRMDGIPSRLVSAVLRSHGCHTYLSDISKPTLDAIRSRRKTIEISILGDSGSQDIIDNCEWLSAQADEFLQRLRSTINSCPLYVSHITSVSNVNNSAVRETFSIMRKILASRLPNVNALGVTTSILFLKFIVPPLADPASSGFIDEEYFPGHKRSIQVFSRMLQQIANDTSFSADKPTCLNEAVTRLHPMTLQIVEELIEDKTIAVYQQIIRASIPFPEELQKKRANDLERMIMRLKTSVDGETSSVSDCSEEQSVH
ncbi:PAS/PAC sensor protein [Planoprotostelium fungivorum]|uniref:PAS/PAC sensor protein n=1 Tax=Planoprotostelium fungivorum TaxID=1890364 RepID=A0A2P6P045_9EUKA|nr:PAS/PAC sensor protein [Planoprotostelium fungivorum]